MDIKREIEQIFRESASSEELFDAFHNALKLRIRDPELYKILLSNVSLSVDEIKLYAEKLCKEFHDLSYEILLWVAKIFETASTPDNLEAALNYYDRAIQYKGDDYKPYLQVLKLYNQDIDFPPRDKISTILRKGLSQVQRKSKLYFGLADFYRKMNDTEMNRKYMVLGSKYARLGK